MPDSPFDADPAWQRFFAALAASPTGFVRLVLAAPKPWHRLDAQAAHHPADADRDVMAPDLLRLIVRPVALRGQPAWSFCFRHATRDITRNHPPDQGLALLQRWLGPRWSHAHLATPQGAFELRIGRRGTGHLRHTPAATAAATAAEPQREPPTETLNQPPSQPPTLLSHDRAKQRWVDPRSPWLVALGVMTPQHTLVPAMARKWKQINRFVEIVAAALSRSALAQAQDLTVVDFGAGKAYLSFALHGWLRAQGRRARMLGLEQRSELVAEVRRVAQALALPDFAMVQGDVRDSQAVPERFDAMIALHACDTATDAAIHRGVRAGAQLIVCSPCCHQQLRPQLLSPQPLKSVFAHGIHAEQQAEMLTDTLRALLLQAEGYDTQVFEFVALEHTRKNKMILAVKRPEGASAERRAAALDEVGALQRFFGFREQALLSMLGEPTR